MKNILAVFVASLILCSCGNDDKDLAPNGEACEVDDDCESDLCVTKLDENLSLPDGMCTIECDIYTDPGESGCDDETEVCLVYLATFDQHCYQRCETDRDCREYWACVDLGDFFNPTLVCIPQVILN